MQLGSHSIEANRTAALVLLVALACSAVAFYLLVGSVEGSSPVITPAISDTSLPHAFPGAG